MGTRRSEWKIMDRLALTGQYLISLQVNTLRCAHLNWDRTGGIDESASGQPSSSTRISQESDRGQTG